MGRRISNFALVSLLSLGLGGCAFTPRDGGLVSENYDKLGSCFYRKSHERDSSTILAGRSLRTLRLADPNELQVSRYIRNLWGWPQRFWTVKFREVSSMQTQVSESDRYPVKRKFVRLMGRVGKCEIALKSENKA